MNFWELLTDIGMLLCASLILGGIAIRLGLSPLIGYLLAGMFLGGPGSIDLVQSPKEIEAIAELGVSLLLFSLGLEFSWSKIKSLSSNIIKSGILQVTLTPLIGFGACFALGLDYKICILIGLIFTLSSTATVFRTLIDLREVDSRHGRNATATLLFQDIAVIPFTIIISSLAATQLSSAKETNVVFIILGALALIVGLYLLLNKIAAPVLNIFSLESNREMAILLAIITSIGSAWAAHSLGISPAVGAFIAGMLLGSSPFATQIRADISPLRIIFLTLFFGAAGMVADPVWIANNFAMVVMLTLGIMFFKTIFSFFIFKFCKNTTAMSIASALCISQIGEFAFVLSSLAKEVNILNDSLNQIIISVTIISLFITPFIINSAAHIGLVIESVLTKQKILKHDIEELSNKSHKPEIFIFGFGPAGNEVARYIKKLKLLPDDVLVIDLNKDCLEDALSYGFQAGIGDVRHIEVLQHYGLSNAKLVVITTPSHESTIKAIDNVRRIAPNAHIIIRSQYQANIESFKNAGAHTIINEELALGKELGKALQTFLKSNQRLD